MAVEETFALKSCGKILEPEIFQEMVLGISLEAGHCETRKPHKLTYFEKIAGLTVVSMGPSSVILVETLVVRLSVSQKTADVLKQLKRFAAELLVRREGARESCIFYLGTPAFKGL